MTLAELRAAWVRRQRWIARLRAIELGRVFGGSSSSGGGTVVGASGTRYQEVPAAAMLARFGRV